MSSIKLLKLSYLFSAIGHCTYFCDEGFQLFKVPIKYFPPNISLPLSFESPDTPSPHHWHHHKQSSCYYLLFSYHNFEVPCSVIQTLRLTQISKLYITRSFNSILFVMKYIKYPNAWRPFCWAPACCTNFCLKSTENLAITIFPYSTINTMWFLVPLVVW